MSENFFLEFCGDYLHARMAPDYDISREGLIEFWQAIAKDCEKYRCRRVLAEGLVIKREMTTMGAFESAACAAKSVLGLSLAFCFPGYTPDELTEFFKNVAHNRGARIEFFSSRKRALEWLQVGKARQTAGDAA